MTDIEKLVQQALLAAGQRWPYLQTSLAALSPVVSEECPSVAVDIWWRLYVHRAWFSTLSPEHRAAIIGLHEVWHLLSDHHGRRQGRDAPGWNRAGDLAINAGHEAELPPTGLFPPPERHLWTAEQHYSAMEEEGGSGPPCAGGSGAGVPQPWELPPSDAPTVSSAEAEAIRETTAAAIREAERNQPGSTPAGAVVWAQERAAQSRVPWSRVLARLVRGVLAVAGTRSPEHRTWRRISARAWARGIVLPGLARTRARAVCVIDTSGSMHDLGARVLGEIRALAQCADLAEITCDTVATRRRRGERYRGGRGTDLRTGLEAAATLDPTAIVVITDCETPWPAAAPSCPVIVANLGTGTPPAWAQVVQVAL